MSVAFKKNINDLVSGKTSVKSAAQPKEKIVQTEDVKIDSMKILFEARKRLPGIKAAMAKLKPEDRYNEVSDGGPIGNEIW